MHDIYMVFTKSPQIVFFGDSSHNFYHYYYHCFNHI